MDSQSPQCRCIGASSNIRYLKQWLLGRRNIVYDDKTDSGLFDDVLLPKCDVVLCKIANYGVWFVNCDCLCS